jgi:hypothetical protein
MVITFLFFIFFNFIYIGDALNINAGYSYIVNNTAKCNFAVDLIIEIVQVCPLYSGSI